MATVTAVNPLTGDREAISLDVPTEKARILAERARAGGMYIDIKIDNPQDDRFMNNIEDPKSSTAPGALPQPTANGTEVDIDRTSFALALRTWRIRHNLTQQEAAQRWGVSRYTIIKAEAGRNVSWEMAYRLFIALSRETVKDSLS